MEYQVTVPEKLPCSFLHLKNKTEAKKAVLIYNSKYKTIDSDILSEWVSDLSLDELKSQIEIPELNLDFGMPQDLPDNLTAEEKNNLPTMKITFPTPLDLISNEEKIKDFLSKICPKAFYSVSAGEL